MCVRHAERRTRKRLFDVTGVYYWNLRSFVAKLCLCAGTTCANFRSIFLFIRFYTRVLCSIMQYIVHFFSEEELYYQGEIFEDFFNPIFIACNYFKLTNYSINNRNFYTYSRTYTYIHYMYSQTHECCKHVERKKKLSTINERTSTRNLFRPNVNRIQQLIIRINEFQSTFEHLILTYTLLQTARVRIFMA